MVTILETVALGMAEAKRLFVNKYFIIMKKIIKFFKLLFTNPKNLVDKVNRRLLWIWNDETYLKKLFLRRVGYKLDLDNPITFNEKLSWLKLYDRNPKYTMLADKYEVMSIPTIIIFKNGEISKKIIGVVDKNDLLDALN